MAHTKSQKAASGNRDSRSKRLGVKMYGGQKVKSGVILIRQRGTKVRAGKGAFIARDHTIHAKVDGTVSFITRNGDMYICVI